MNLIQINSLGLILLGVFIIIFPQIIGIVLGVILIIIGLQGLAFSRNVARIWRIKDK